MKSNHSGLLFFVIGCVLVIGISLSISALTINDEGALNATSAMGFSNIKVVDSGIMFTSWRGCDEKDFSWYKVRATNSNKEDVNLLVCKGFLKGYTVRIN